jgi:hypothetical protein
MNKDAQAAWTRLLMEAELAKNHHMANIVGGFGTVMTPNPIVEKLLPSLLFIQVGSFLDESFEGYIDNNSLPFGRPYRSDFNGRICFLNDRGLLADGVRVHALRNKRNGLAHDPAQSCTWDELENGIQTTDQELQHLQLAGPRPKYEFFGERRPGQPPPGYVLRLDYRYGLKQDGIVVVEIAWHRDCAPLSGPPPAP